MASYYSELLNQNNKKDWEALNQASSKGSFYHTLRWKDVLERSFGYKSKYFMIFHDKDPIALCPFFEQTVRRFKALVPPPFTDLKHIIISEPSNRTVIETIVEKSISIANEDACAFVIFVNSNIETNNMIRAVCPNQKKKTAPFPVNGYLMLDLEKNNPTHVWENELRSRHKRQIRRFEQAGFEYRETRSEKDVDIFYEYYSKNLSHIGAVPFNRSHFNIILTEYKKDLRMTLLEKDNEVAGGLISLLDQDKKIMYLRYLAINRDIDIQYRNYVPSEALMWEALTKAYELGYKAVCFGTNSKDEQDLHYIMKKRFGCNYEDYYAELMPMNFIYGLFYRISRYI